MSDPADPSGAVAVYLKTTPVDSLVSGRIYRPELDEDVDEQMPTQAIVVRRAGGYALFGGANIPLGDPRLEVFCYGESYLDADRVASAVVNALKALRGGTYDGTRLYWARIESGPLPMADERTNWPCVVITAQVAHCELTVA